MGNKQLGFGDYEQATAKTGAISGRDGEGGSFRANCNPGLSFRARYPEAP
jgi:hypothetical protein